jgi:hypothetical protein
MSTLGTSDLCRGKKQQRSRCIIGLFEVERGLAGTMRSTMRRMSRIPTRMVIVRRERTRKLGPRGQEEGNEDDRIKHGVGDQREEGTIFLEKGEGNATPDTHFHELPSSINSPLDD